MKRILLSCLLILFIYTLKAQDTHLNDVVNTLKERISLAGYAQVGYTYDDAGEKASNTGNPPMKRAAIDRYGNSSREIWMADTANGSDVTGFGYYYGSWAIEWGSVFPGNEGGKNYYPVAARHRQNAANCLIFDGHVEAVPVYELLNYNERRWVPGTNWVGGLEDGGLL